MLSKKVKTRIRIFLLVLLLLVSAAVIILKVFGNRNNYSMNGTVQDGLNEIKKHYKVTQLDAGEYQDMRFYGLMKFHVDQYQIEKLGNLSVMTADMGFMQMVSFLITPFEKNVPMCAMDFMYILNSRKSIVEFYDLAADTNSAHYQEIQDKLKEMTARYDNIEDLPREAAWYDEYLSVVMHKKLSVDDESDNIEMFEDALSTYIEATVKMPALSEEEMARQHANTQNYCDGLISKGGVSTDVFKKKLGEEKTHDFFNKVFFGTERYFK